MALVKFSGREVIQEEYNMVNGKAAQGNVIHFPQPKKNKDKARKGGLNRNKEGSVRRINGKVYQKLHRFLQEGSDLIVAIFSIDLLLI